MVDLPRRHHHPPRRTGRGSRLAATLFLVACFAFAGGEGNARTLQAELVDVAAVFGTDDIAVRSAIAQARERNLDLYLADSTFTYEGVLVLDGIRVFGSGTLQAADAAESAVVLTGVGPELHGVTVRSPAASSRLATDESAAVVVRDAVGFVVENVTIRRAASAGVLVRRSSEGRIAGNRIGGTLADGIHVTGGSHDVEILYNRLRNTGDDLIGLVSYRTDQSRVHDISVHHNTGNNRALLDPHGRGIAVIGPYGVKVRANRITGTSGAGIYLASEPGWRTYGVEDVRVTRNVIRRPAREIHEANILVWAGQRRYRITNVRGARNDLDRSKKGVRLVTAARGSYSDVRFR